MILLTLVLAVPAVIPVGDGGTWRFIASNQAIHTASFGWGAQGALRDGVEIPGRGERSLYVQCVGDPTPGIAVEIERRRIALEVEPVNLPEGPPVLVISAHAETRPVVAAQVAHFSPGVPVKGLIPESVPSDFGALRFASVIAIGGEDWELLDAAQREAVRGATAAGATLVVGAGDAEIAKGALSMLSPVVLGALGRPSPALQAGLPRASGARELDPRGARVLVQAAGKPVLVESRLGLGVVRVLATPLIDLDAGDVSRQVLAPDDRALTQALAWVERTAPTPAPARTVLSTTIWLLLGVFVLLALFARRLRWVGVGAAVVLWGAAIAIPPTANQAIVAGGRALAVPVGEGMIVVGATDVEFGAGGPRTFAAEFPFSLDDVRPGGACVMHGGDESVLVVDGPPGRRSRVTWFAMLPAASGGGAGDVFPSYPPGPLADRPLSALTGRSPITDASFSYWVAPALSDDSATPVQLQTPTPTPTLAP